MTKLNEHGIYILSMNKLSPLLSLNSSNTKLVFKREHTRALALNVLKQQIPLKNTYFYLPGASCPVEIHARVTEFMAHKIGCV